MTTNPPLETCKGKTPPQFSKSSTTFLTHNPNYLTYYTSPMQLPFTPWPFSCFLTPHWTSSGSETSSNRSAVSVTLVSLFLLHPASPQILWVRLKASDQTIHFLRLFSNIIFPTEKLRELLPHSHNSPQVSDSSVFVLYQPTFWKKTRIL